MKKLVSLFLILVLALSAVSASAVKLGELSYLNDDGSKRAKLLLEVYNTLEKNNIALFRAPDSDSSAFDEIEVVPFDNLNSMFMALQNGQIDMMITYSKVFNYLMVQNGIQPGEDYKDLNTGVVRDVFSAGSEYSALPPEVQYMMDQILGTDFSFMLKDSDTALRDEINAAIAELKADGSIQKMMQDQFDALKEGKPLEATEIEKIEGADTIRVAVTGDLPPMDFIDENGKPAGFNTAVLSAISKKIRKNIELVSIDSGARAVALASGSVDAVFWCRTAAPDIELAKQLPEDKKLGIAMLLAAVVDMRDSSLDVPDNTILTDPYWHDVYVLRDWRN